MRRGDLPDDAIAPAQATGLTRWLDQGAIGLSALCLLHCLAFPLVVLALPVVGEVLPNQWWVHPAIFVLAVPMATIALVRGWYHHRDRRPVVIGGVGLALLGVGLLAAEGSATEIVFTVLGGAVVATAHLLNRRLGKHRHAPHG
jgi:uncharacterized membrane protein